MPIGEPRESAARLTPLDQAVILYRQHNMDFIEMVDAYISAFPEAKRYAFFVPGGILLGHEEVRVNPLDPNSALRDPYWMIVYAQGTGLETFTRLMPYYLDTVGFYRYLKYPDQPFRLYPMKKFLSKEAYVKHHQSQGAQSS